MLNDSESLLLEQVSTIDDIKMLYSPDNGVEKVSQFIESCKKNGFLANLEKIKDSDKKAYVETVKSLTDMIAMERLDPEDLQTIVRSITVELENNGLSRTEKEYGTSGVAIWTDFNIKLKEGLFEKNEKGEFKDNIGQTIGHEISHSIIELHLKDKLEIPQEIMNLIDNSNTNFESKHIQTCIKNKLDTERISIERLADLFGLFLDSSSKEDFIEKKAHLITDQGWQEVVGTVPTTESIEDLLQKEQMSPFLEESIRQYETLQKNWPYIKEQFKEVELEEPEIDTLNNEEEMPLGTEKGLPISNIAAEYGLPQGGEKITKTDNAQKPTSTYKETPDLGRKNDKSTGWIGKLGDFVKSFKSVVE